MLLGELLEALELTDPAKVSKLERPQDKATTTTILIFIPIDVPPKMKESLFDRTASTVTT